jgi:uncharacterized protein YutE (UPF0331/DUF86 family)
VLSLIFTIADHLLSTVSLDQPETYDELLDMLPAHHVLSPNVRQG